MTINHDDKNSIKINLQQLLANFHVGVVCYQASCSQEKRQLSFRRHIIISAAALFSIEKWKVHHQCFWEPNSRTCTWFIGKLKKERAPESNEDSCPQRSLDFCKKSVYLYKNRMKKRRGLMLYIYTRWGAMHCALHLLLASMQKPWRNRSVWLVK